MNVPLLNQPNQSSNDVFYSGELYLQFESLRLNAPSKPSWLSNFTLYVLVHHYTRTLAGVNFFLCIGRYNLYMTSFPFCSR